MQHYTREQVKIARRANLYDYIQKHHPDIIGKKENGCFHLRGNYSLAIREGYSGYTDFATGDHGNSIDFLVRYLNYQVDEAIIALSDTSGCLSVFEVKSASNKREAIQVPPTFPEPISGPYKRVYAYLVSRGIARETITMLVDRDILYQDICGNAVFVDIARTWGEIRGTYSNIPYHGMVANCRQDGYWGFRAKPGEPTRAYICESAIDAISLYELHCIQGIDMQNTAYVSIGGVTKQGAINRLKKGIKDVILAVDNDTAGQACRNRNPDLEAIIPIAKDWNADLISGAFYK